MNLNRFLPWCRQPVQPQTSVGHDNGVEELVAETAAEDERPLACGWFDSSHDLQHGLCVKEHASPDTLARDLPLANWLELRLAGWRPQLDAARQA
jgi:hypothetical protein